MFSFFNLRTRERPRAEGLAHLLVSEQGEIILANQAAVDLIRFVTHKRMTVKGVIGRTIGEILGKELRNTFIGTFMENKASFNVKLMIGNQLYQIVVVEIPREGKILYEFFYLPIRPDYGSYSKHFLQNMVHKLAVEKGFANVDWIRQVSDDHCKQLISCLISHEHTSALEEYCPYKYHCKFNPVYGCMQLDRRSYFRVKINITGELYLKAYQDRSITPHMTRKKVICQALDISMGGIKLLTKNICLPEESMINLVFEEFIAEGLVVWTKNSGRGDWLTGIKFSDLEDEHQCNIIKLMTKKRL